MKRDVRVHIQDILESIAKIEEYTRTLSQNDFCTNTQVQDAVLKRLIQTQLIKCHREERKRFCHSEELGFLAGTAHGDYACHCEERE